jgi:hypothetical protein
VAEVDTYLAGNSRVSRVFYHVVRFIVVGLTRLVTGSKYMARTTFRPLGPSF